MLFANWLRKYDMPMFSTVYHLTAPRRFIPQTKRLTPELAPGYVRLKVLACGICGSDISHFLGLRRVKYPISLGHEFCAEVTESVSPALPEGTLVVSDLNYRCGECALCINGQSHLCRMGSVGYFSNRAFANYMDILDAYLTPVKSTLAPHLAALTEPLACVLHALDRAPYDPSDRILIVGAGGIGALFVYALIARGHAPEAISLCDPLPRARNVANAFGVIETPSPAAGDYDLVIEASSSVSGFCQSANALRGGGTLIMFSHLDGHSGIEVPWHMLTRKDVRMALPHLNGDRGLMYPAMTLLERSPQPLDSLLLLRPLSEIQEAFDLYPTPEASKLILMP
ncbi:MAG: alcohol dehydrogenase catalytic domain-containing protein [Alphaproteobacteria bacterium]|nr:alcohol dehydrogenase catalytic domain-containing protein [Alphaproteobacteria bacterium]